MSGRTARRRGILFVISAPSGAGKTTAAARLLERAPGLAMSVSHTTRKPRQGETDGGDYHFVSGAEFDAMIERGEFLEWASVHGNRYGTSRTNIEKIVRDEGRDLLLDIDTQGAAALRKTDLNLVTIFIMPPSIKELERRLSGRGTDSADVLRLRLANARAEMERAPEYDYIVVNDDLGRAVEELCAIVTAERLRVKNRTVILDDFTAEEP